MYYSSEQQIRAEFAQEVRNPSFPGTVGLLNRSDPYQWVVQLYGPKHSYYNGGKWILDVTIPTNYPSSPPQVRFRNKIFHPNISEDGFVCVDILKGAWKSNLTMSNVLGTMPLLLGKPNPKSPLNSEAAVLFEQNKTLYFNTVVDWIKKYAK